MTKPWGGGRGRDTAGCKLHSAATDWILRGGAEGGGGWGTLTRPVHGGISGFIVASSASNNSSAADTSRSTNPKCSTTTLQLKPDSRLAVAQPVGWFKVIQFNPPPRQGPFFLPLNCDRLDALQQIHFHRGLNITNPVIVRPVVTLALGHCKHTSLFLSTFQNHHKPTMKCQFVSFICIIHWAGSSSGL